MKMDRFDISFLLLAAALALVGWATLLGLSGADRLLPLSLPPHHHPDE